jgi:hypothetical protein
MDQNEEEYRRELSQRVDELHRQMVADGTFEQTEELERLVAIHASIDALRAELAQGLDIISRSMESQVGHADYRELDPTECSAELGHIRTQLEAIRKGLESSDWSRNTLVSEVSNLSSMIEEQAEYTRMSIGRLKEWVAYPMAWLALASLFMVYRFWPAEWSLRS